jgi:hypothetical protein
MIIKSLSETTPDLISITIDEHFHESLNDVKFPETIQKINLHYYSQSLIDVIFPDNLHNALYVLNFLKITNINFNW